MSEERLGLASGRVVVVPYDPRWPALFEAAATEIRAALGADALEVHHVGSTAVTDLAAKLAPLGYEHRPDEEIPDRYFFRRFRAAGRTARRTPRGNPLSCGACFFRSGVSAPYPEPRTPPSTRQRRNDDQGPHGARDSHRRGLRPARSRRPDPSPTGGLGYQTTGVVHVRIACARPMQRGGNFRSLTAYELRKNDGRWSVVDGRILEIT